MPHGLMQKIPVQNLLPIKILDGNKIFPLEVFQQRMVFGKTTRCIFQGLAA